MARRKRAMTADKVKRWIKEGRGQGRGAEYRPWYEIHDVASKGLVSRVRGHITGRVHHLLSKAETDYFLILDLMSPPVVDIREQFPLLPLATTEAIAEICGIKHPTDPRSQKHVPLTTDFVVTVARDGREVDLARTVKYAKDLSRKRVIEKFEIERRYWQDKGVDWGIVTPSQLPRGLAYNCRFLHDYVNYSPDGLEEQELLDIAEAVWQRVVEGIPLRHAARACDELLGYEAGTSLGVAYRMIATRKWPVDLREPIHPGKLLPLLDASTNSSQEEE